MNVVDGIKDILHLVWKPVMFSLPILLSMYPSVTVTVIFFSFTFTPFLLMVVNMQSTWVLLFCDIPSLNVIVKEAYSSVWYGRGVISIAWGFVYLSIFER